MKLVHGSSILKSLSGLFALALLFSISQTAKAQYLVSTKAGFINRAEGRVLIQREENAPDEQGRVSLGRASLGTQMKDGDRLITESSGRAEVLLTPGSYLRLYQNTEIRAVGTSLIAPHFELLKGSVIVEVAQLSKGSAIQIDTPNGPVTIGKEGIQRINVGANGTGVEVRQGELLLGTVDQFLAKSGTKVGKGKMVRLVGANALSQGNEPLIAKLNKDAATDDFDLWSYYRAQTLMQANSSALVRSSMRDSMAFGWFYDPFYNCYTFMPGRRLFFSPYGFPFFSRYSDYYFYFPYGYGPYGYGPRWGGGGGSQPGNEGGGGSTTPGRVIAGHDRAPINRTMAAREVRAAESSSSFGADRGVSPGGSSSSAGSASVSAPSSAVSISAPAARGESGGTSSASRPARP
jgi:hypothetical protein